MLIDELCRCGYYSATSSFGGRGLRDASTLALLENVMTRFTLIAFFVLAGATARAADPPGDELKKLQGQWQVFESEKNGKKVNRDDENTRILRFVFKDNELTVRAADGSREKKMTIKLN